MTGASGDEGGPITELAGLSEETSEVFSERIRGGIERRRLVAQGLELTWSSLSIMVREFIEMVFGGLGSAGGKRPGGSAQ